MIIQDLVRSVRTCAMFSISLFILYIVSVYGYSCYSCRLDIEAENGDSEGGVQMQRSRASNRITVLVTEEEDITFELQVAPSMCQLTVDYVQYSNDGLSDVIVLYLNMTIIGQFSSEAASGNGRLWNVMRRSGQVGNPVQVFQGISELQIVAKTTDEFGVELDKISLQFDCSNTSSVSDVCPQSVVNITGSTGSNDGTPTTNDIPTTGSSGTTGSTGTTDSTDGTGTKDNTLSNKDIIAIPSSVGLFLLVLVGSVVLVVSVRYKCRKKKYQEIVSWNQSQERVCVHNDYKHMQEPWIKSQGRACSHNNHKPKQESLINTI